MDVTKKWEVIKVEPHVKRQLDSLKVHKNQSYSEVIETLLKPKKT